MLFSEEYRMNMVPTTFIRANMSHLVQKLAFQTNLAQIPYVYTPKSFAPKYHQNTTTENRHPAIMLRQTLAVSKIYGLWGSICYALAGKGIAKISSTKKKEAIL